MKYYKDDLNFIFIRAKNKKGKWNNLSVRKLDKQQWEDWLMRKWGKGKRFWKSIDGKVENNEWTDNDKLGILNWLAEQGAVFCMIKRGKVRENYKS